MRTSARHIFLCIHFFLNAIRVRQLDKNKFVSCMQVKSIASVSNELRNQKACKRSPSAMWVSKLTWVTVLNKLVTWMKFLYNVYLKA